MPSRRAAHNRRMNERWEKGIPHEDASVRTMRMLMDADVGDHFEWKKGGDGDNGEALMFQLDEYLATHPVEPTPCCETMASQLDGTKCEQHGAECPDNVVKRGPESGRLFLVAANASYTFQFCPWCGARVQAADPER